MMTATLERIDAVDGKPVAYFSDGSTEPVPEGFTVDECDGTGSIPAGSYRFLPSIGPGPGRGGGIVQPSIDKVHFRAAMEMLEYKNYPERFARADTPFIVHPPAPA